MKKKALGVSLALMISMVLGACGGETQNTASGDSGASQPAVEATATPEPTAEPQPTPVITQPNYDGIEVKSNGAIVSVHDPSIKVFDGRYYIYGSHMTSAYSDNMQKWTWIGKTYNDKNPLYNNLFDENLTIFDYSGDNGNGNYSVWAPDVIYIEEMGKYVMYFCTSSTYIKSNLCYATADAPEGPYTYQGELLYSGFTEETIEQTNVFDVVSEEYATETYLKLNGEYENEDWPNCIDPAPFYDEDGRLWMVYGSWSGGIFLLELDPQTGLIIHPEADAENSVDPYFGKRLMGGDHKSIEGPFIEYNEEAGYYYLYVSYGALDRMGGYQIRVFRSETPDGEYVDMNGKYPTKGVNHSYFGLKLSGNYYLPSLKYAYMATGGQSTFRDTDGKYYCCFHSRFDGQNEYHEPVVKQMFMNEEGWPVMAPYGTKGETISAIGYDKSELIGDYYFINQGMKIDSNIAQPLMITLNEDGTVSGSIVGTWNVTDGTYYMHLTYEEEEYSGVFCAMQDQTGVDVMTFTAVGDNESIWGVKY